jgi:hypothetical protein
MKEIKERKRIITRLRENNDPRKQYKYDRYDQNELKNETAENERKR